MQWSYGEGSPQGVELEKVLHPPPKKKLNPIFSKNLDGFFLNFRDQYNPYNIRMADFASQTRDGCYKEDQKLSLWGPGSTLLTPGS